MRTLARSLRPGDVLVGNAIYENYWTFVMLQGIGCDGVFEINGSRSRSGKRRTHLKLTRPTKPEWMDVEAYELCPRHITVRQVASHKRGYQDTLFITTLTEQSLISDREIIELYLRRWNVETDFRSLKCALDAGILGCRSHDMIEKELWVHLLAYNLTRLLMSEAAALCQREPRSISFRHTVCNYGAPGRSAACNSCTRARVHQQGTYPSDTTPEGPLRHSDRGRTYTANDYRDALTVRGIRTSTSRIGYRWDNGVPENFFATLKKDQFTATNSLADDRQFPLYSITLRSSIIVYAVTQCSATQPVEYRRNNPAFVYPVSTKPEEFQSCIRTY